MLINSELKYKANINLKKSYWVCVAVCLIFSILTGVLDELPTVDNLSLIHNDGTVFETLLTVSSFSAMPNNFLFAGTCNEHFRFNKNRRSNVDISYIYFCIYICIPPAAVYFIPLERWYKTLFYGPARR